MNRIPLLLGLVLLLAAQAPTPPEPPPEKQAESVPAPPEKPEKADGGSVPMPTEKPEEAEQPGAHDVPKPPAAPDRRPEDDPGEESEGGGEQADPSGPADPAGDRSQAEPEVPLPREMPDEVEQAQERDEQDTAPPVTDTTDPIAEAACRIRLKKLPAEWKLQDPLEENRCGIGHGVRVTEVAGVELLPAAMLNCRTAEALTLWVRDDVIPAAREHLEKEPTSLLVAGSYVCRGRNGRPGARLSEHGFGNAVDVGGFVLGKDTIPIEAQDPKESPARLTFQKEIRKAACERFTTVLGPGADASHKTHFHFDLRTRSNGYRLCQ